MRQEVLCHDARDFSEVIEDGEAWILLPLIGWAKPTKLVIGLKRHRRAGLARKRRNMRINKREIMTYN